MRNSMKLIITDDPVGDVKMALAKELQDRKQAFDKLHVAGHVHVIEDGDPVNIRCNIEDEVFSDPRDRFPSIVTMAKLQLAVAAGRSCRNDRRDMTDVTDARSTQMANDARTFANGHWHQIARRAMGKSELMTTFPRWIDEDTPKRVTATVKKFVKGLRP